MFHNKELKQSISQVHREVVKILKWESDKVKGLADLRDHFKHNKNKVNDINTLLKTKQKLFKDIYTLLLDHTNDQKKSNIDFEEEEE